MLEWITGLMNSMGYFGVALLMFLENVFPPIPSELIMPLAGYIVTQGKLSFVGVVLAGTIGSVVGALPLYYVGKMVGQQRLKTWADKYGRWLTVSGEELDKTKAWFDKRGGVAVLICRLVPGVRSLISIPAGINEMNLGVFLLYTTIGAGVWSALLATAGKLLGNNFKQVDKFLGPASYVILGALVIVYIVRIIRHKPAAA